jgi:hypothetical protein
VCIVVGWLCVIPCLACVFLLVDRAHCFCWPCVLFLTVCNCYCLASVLLFIDLCIVVVWPGVVIGWPLVLLVSRA